MQPEGAPSTVLDPSVESFLAAVSGRPGPFSLTALTGGISPRRFARVTLGPNERAVLMLVPEHTPDVVFARERGRPWPFLEVRELLEGVGVRVPKLLGADTERGLLLVEDLGETLAERLERAPESREALYRRAVIDLGRAQAALEPLPRESVVRERGFDAGLFQSELEHFWDWAVAARGLGGGARELFEQACAVLVPALAALPRGFCHRDYQSRNLMVVEGDAESGLAWIDFQDALLGPRAYDLVALLCDSYQPFERAFVERRLDDYATERGLAPEERKKLGREFDLLAVQRKLKDAGRFVFVDKQRGDPSYLGFVGPSLGIVLDALGHLADVPELRALGPLIRAAQSA